MKKYLVLLHPPGIFASTLLFSAVTISAFAIAAAHMLTCKK